MIFVIMLLCRSILWFSLITVDSKTFVTEDKAKKCEFIFGRQFLFSGLWHPLVLRQIYESQCLLYIIASPWTIIAGVWGFLTVVRRPKSELSKFLIFASVRNDRTLKFLYFIFWSIYFCLERIIHLLRLTVHANGHSRPTVAVMPSIGCRV